MAVGSRIALGACCKTDFGNNCGRRIFPCEHKILGPRRSFQAVYAFARWGLLQQGLSKKH